MDKHTPTPWSVGKAADNWKPGPGWVVETKEFEIARDLSREDAEFICKAVNEYESLKAQRDELVEALTKAWHVIMERPSAVNGELSLSLEALICKCREGEKK